MAMFAAFPSTIICALPTVVESIVVDGMAANIAMQPIPNHNLQLIPIPNEDRFLNHPK